MSTNLPSIPQYYADYIDPSVDLLQNPKQCCPFHKENSPSWSFSLEKNAWRCFGECKTGGGVRELHMINYKLKDIDEAERSLRMLYNLGQPELDFRAKEEIVISESKVRYGIAYNRAISKAKTPEDYLELDYIMSKYPPSVEELEDFSDARRSKFTK